jgi:hypothetical protein
MRLLLAMVVALIVVAPTEDDAVETAASVYVRSDSDSTTVVSPRARVRVPVAGPRNHVDLVYAVDVWTSASVDVRTAATGRVREQRDEVDVGADRTLRWGTVGVGYRFSHEADYVSHAGSANVRIEARRKTITVDGRISAGGDSVGRSGDASFSRGIAHAGAYAGYTHVLGRNTLAQLSTEFRFQQGYLSSPYRWVSLGGMASCVTSLGLCIPEVHPGRRMRSAWVARLRQALSPRWSVGGAYRFYFDTWGVQGHTGRVDVRVMPRPRVSLGLQGRVHGQSRASFYRVAYGEAGTFFTRDRELSATWNARATATAEVRVPVGTSDLKIGALLGGGVYRYPEFVGLDTVGVVEGSVSLGVAL